MEMCASRRFLWLTAMSAHDGAIQANPRPGEGRGSAGLGSDQAYPGVGAALRRHAPVGAGCLFLMSGSAMDDVL
jgi:hypothetical protein